MTPRERARRLAEDWLAPATALAAMVGLLLALLVGP
jgi:hypothetical protein